MIIQSLGEGSEEQVERRRRRHEVRVDKGEYLEAIRKQPLDVVTYVFYLIRELRVDGRGEVLTTAPLLLLFEDFVCGRRDSNVRKSSAG